jgi:hypothetical protein
MASFWSQVSIILFKKLSIFIYYLYSNTIFDINHKNHESSYLHNLLIVFESLIINFANYIINIEDDHHLTIF